MHHVFLLFFTATALSVNQQRTVRCSSEAHLLRSAALYADPCPHPASLPPGDQPLPNPPQDLSHPPVLREGIMIKSHWSNCHIVNVNVNEAGNFLKFHLCWFQIKPKQSDCYHWLYQRTTSSISYSCTDPNCRDSPLELDNSRLSLDENCLIRGEN